MKRFSFAFSLLAFLFSHLESGGAIVEITGSGNWSTFGIGAGDDVIIKNNAVVTVNVNNGQCNSLQVGSGVGASPGPGSIIFQLGRKITVGTACTIGMGGMTGTITMTAGGTLVCGQLIHAVGTFNPGIGTVEIRSTSSLPAGIGTFNHLTFNTNGGTLTLGANLIVLGNLYVNQGTLSTSGSNYSLTVNGNTDIDNGETFNLQGSVVTFYGNLICGGTFNGGTSTAIFAGTTQISGNGTADFFNLTVNNGASLSLARNITVSGNMLMINGAVFSPGTRTVTLNGGGSNVLGGTAATIPFYNLTVSKSGGGSVSPGASLQTVSVANNFTLSQGNFTASPLLFSIENAFLQVNGTFTAGAEINVAGNFTRNAGTFNHGNGLVLFDGTGNQNLAGPAITTFYELKVNKPGGTLTLQSATAFVNHRLTMTNGTFNTGINTLSGSAGITAVGGTLRIGKTGTTVPELTGISTAYALTGGTIELNGGGAQTLRPAVDYFHLAFSGSGGKVLTGVSTVNGNFLVSGASFLNGNSALTVNGTMTYSTSGNSTFTSPHTINLNSFMQSSGTLNDAGININITGALFSRTGGNFNATGTVTFTSAGNHSIGGILTTFNNLVKTGTGTLSLNANATVNTLFSISAGIFISGTQTLSGAADFFMDGGEFRTAKLTVVQPELTGTYTLVDNGNSGIEFNGAGYQKIRVLDYQYLTLSNAGVKEFQPGTTGIKALIMLQGAAIPDFLTHSTTLSYNGVFFPNQSVSPFNYYHLHLGNGTKTFSATTSIKGNFFGSGFGDANSNSATIIFDGTMPQTIGPAPISADLYQCNITNSSGVTNTGALTLYHTLTLGPNTPFTNSGSLTFFSSSTLTARLAEIPATSSFTGNISMQRHVPAIPLFNGGYWHMMGAPVTGAGFQSVVYDESISGNLNLGYTPCPTCLTTLNAGQGGFRDLGNLATTFNYAPAPPNTGNVVVATTYTLSSGPAHDGWNLISNPYPSEIEWDAAGITLNGVGNAAYIWNGINYTTFMLGDGVEIPSCQGIWVKAVANGNVSFSEGAKSSGNPTYNKTAVFNYPRILLKMVGNGYDDFTDIRIQAGATGNMDPSFDAFKLAGISAAPHLASVSADNFQARINAFPSPSSNLDVPIIARCIATGNYVLQVESISQFPASSCVFLEDVETGNFYDLKTVSSISFFQLGNTSDAPRFILHISPAITFEIEEANCNNGNYSGSVIANPMANGPWDFVWKDAGGNVIQTNAGSTLPDTLAGVAAGNYSLEVTNATGNCVSTGEQVLIGGPSPYETNEVITNVSCFGFTDGSVNLTPTGGAGTLSFLWSSGSISEDILNAGAGVYALEMSDDSGCVFLDTFELAQPAQITAGFTFPNDTIFLSSGGGFISFTNNSTGAVSYQWNFGDGSPISTLANPTYQYLVPGNFLVTLSANNGACANTYSMAVVVIESPLVLLEMLQPKFKIQYGKDAIRLYLDGNWEGRVKCTLLNILGQPVLPEFYFPQGDKQVEFKTATFASGIYLVSVETENFQKVQRVLISR